MYTIIQFQSLPEAESIVNALINAGADVNGRYFNDNTPLHMCNNNHKITKALINAGADVNAKNNRGSTPIMAKFNYDVVKTLIDAGADINAKSNDGGTPLHSANTEVKVVKALIDAGADVNAKDNKGQTPLMAAFNVDVAKALIDAGADVNAKNNDGKTPLMKAFDVDIAKALVDAGADVNAKDKDGKTALEIAESLKLTKIADFLRSSTKPNTAPSQANQPSAEIPSNNNPQIPSNNDVDAAPIEPPQPQGPSPDELLTAKAKSIASQITTHVMNEIRMEEGKSVGQFFSIKNALKPCKKAPNTCEETIGLLVDESFDKYARGVIATTIMLNDDKFDSQLFIKVSAELKQNYDSFNKIKVISTNSPVGREIMSASNLSDDIKEQIFYIWYLRQYPYAGEDIWKTQISPKRTWKDYLSMAETFE